MDDNYSRLKMYILVNSDLKMSAGKKCAQTCHGCGEVILRILKNAYTQNNEKSEQDYITLESWRNKGMCKIILKCSEAEMKILLSEEQMKGENCEAFGVIDEGLTEVPPNSFTVLCFFPSNKSRFRHLKLL